MSAPITLDEFFDMAQLGGQIKACHDIFEILRTEDETTVSDKLSEYQSDIFKKFKRAQLKFKMAGGKVRLDEESIESLG